METMTFRQRLSRVQLELKAPKSQYNSFGKYYYRNQEDILEAAKPILDKYGLSLVVSDEIVEVSGTFMVRAKAIVWDDEGTKAEVYASAGIEMSKKGMDVSQSFGSSSSYARKYALNGLFLIDDTKDADFSNRPSKGVSENQFKDKDRLPRTGAALDKVIAYLQTENGSLDTVKSKYIVKEDDEKFLKQQLVIAKKK